MIMSNEDISQEYALIKVSNPELSNIAINRDVIDKQQSRAWNSIVSYKRIEHTGLNIDDLIDLKTALLLLTSRERVVIKLFLCGYKIKEIKNKLGISQRRVCELKQTAIKRMRDYLCHSEM